MSADTSLSTTTVPAAQVADEEPAGNALSPGVPATSLQILSLGVGLIILCLLLIYVFVSLWPPELANTAKGSDATQIRWLGTHYAMDTNVEARLLLLVVVTGALGSFVHTATSFGDFVGNQKLSTNWVWWYILRPFIGMALAAVVYAAIRAGFLTGGGTPNTLNLFGVAALSGMVGMFSKQATDKLSEVFNTLFRTAPGGGDVQRNEGLDIAASRVGAPTIPSPNLPAAIASAADPDRDGCTVGLLAPTPDEALPAARGGVG